jgi:hypothetical protein
MGEATNRGTFEQRRAAAIAAGRLSPSQNERVLQEGIKNSEAVKCPCGCDAFTQVFEVRRISGIYTPNGQLAFISGPPVPICLNCHRPLNVENNANEQETVQADISDVQGRIISGTDSEPIHQDGEES